MDSELLERLPARIGELGQRLHQEVMRGVPKLSLSSLKLRLRVRLLSLQRRGFAQECRPAAPRGCGVQAPFWEAVRS